MKPKRRSPRLRHWILVSAVALGFFWLVVQLWLQSAGVPWLINRKPDKLKVEWSHLSMLVPGKVAAYGVAVRGQNRHLQWLIEVEEVHLDVDLLRLARKTFRGSHIRGSGLSFRMRRRFPDGVEGPTLEEGLVPIPGLDVLPVGDPPARRDRPPGWRIELEGLDFERFDELWFNALRLSGDGRVSGDLAIQVRGPLNARDVTLDWRDGALQAGELTLAEAVSLRLEESIDLPSTRGLHTFEALAAMRGNLDLEAQVDHLGFLHEALGGSDNLVLEGSGELNLSAGFDGGALLPGTRLDLSSPGIDAVLAGFRIGGAGTVTGRVDEGADGTTRTRVVVDLPRVGASTSEDSASLVSGSDARIDVSTEGAELRGGFRHPRVLVDMPHLEAPTLESFASILPLPEGMALAGGPLTASLHVDASEQSADGRLEVAVPSVELTARGHRVDGALRLLAGLGGTLAEPELLLDGLRLELTEPGSSGGRDLVALEVRSGRAAMGAVSPGADAVPRLVSLEAELDGSVSELGALMPLFAHGEWLAPRGHVSVNGKLAWRQGRFLPGSELILSSERLGAGVGDWAVDGGTRVRVAVDQEADGPRSVLSLRIREPTLGTSGKQQLSAPEFDLQASLPTGMATEMALDSDADPVARRQELLSRLRAEATLQSGDLFDATALNEYLPGGDVLALNAGRATVDGSFSARDGRGEARFRVDGRDLDAAILGSLVRADVEVELLSRMAKLGERRYDLAGSRFRIAQRDPEDGEGGAAVWSAELEVPRAELELEPEFALRSRIEFGMTDSRPLLHLVALDRPVVQRFEPLVVVGDARGGSDVALGPERVRIERAELHSDLVELYAELDLEKREGAAAELHDLTLRAELLQALEISAADIAAFLPRTELLVLRDGMGSLEGRIDFEHLRGDAELAAAGKGFLIDVLEESLRTDLAVDLSLRTEDLASERFDLAGSRVRLDETLWLEDRRAARHPPWWGEVEIGSGEVELTEPPTFDGAVALRLRDTRPLVYLAGRQSRMVRWFGRLLEIEDVEGGAHLHSGPDGLRLEQLRIDGDGLRVRGHVDFTDGAKSTLVWVRLHGLGVAFERGDESHFRLIGARKWFDKRLAELGAGSLAD